MLLNLKPETELKAVKRAAELGITVEEYIKKIILEDINEGQNLEKVFEPIRRTYQNEKEISENN
jgi:hypothetical protein